MVLKTVLSLLWARLLPSGNTPRGIAIAWRQYALLSGLGYCLSAIRLAASLLPSGNTRCSLG